MLTGAAVAGDVVREGGLRARAWSGDSARSRITESVEPSPSSSPVYGRRTTAAGCDGPLGPERCTRALGGEVARLNSSGSLACRKGEAPRGTGVDEGVVADSVCAWLGTPVEVFRESWPSPGLGALGSGFGYLMCSAVQLEKLI